MLIDKNKNSEVRSIKLISGEEIIALSNFDDRVIKIKKPLMFVIPSDKSSNEVVFSPWLIGMDFDQEITIQLDKVIVNIKPSKIAEEKYLEAIR